MTELHPAVAAILAATNPAGRWRCTPPNPDPDEPDNDLVWPDPSTSYHHAGPHNPHRADADHAAMHAIPHVRLPRPARDAITRIDLHIEAERNGLHHP